MKNKSLIERVTIDPDETLMAEKDWAKITGQPLPAKKQSFYYRHTKTGDEYQSVIGAFALPSLQYPGFAVVIALDRNLDPENGINNIHVLAETEAGNIKELIKGCLNLRDIFGAYPALFDGWRCDLNEADSYRVFQAIQELDVSSFFYPRCGPYTDFKEYLKTLAENKMRLFRGGCVKLKSFMAIVQPEAITNLMPEDNPAVASIAYGVTAIISKGNLGAAGNYDTD